MYPIGGKYIIEKKIVDQTYYPYIMLIDIASFQQQN